MELKKIIENTKEVYMSENSLEYLINMERVLDEMNIYAYKNWQKGELIEGPVFEKYFVSAKFMWPYKEMPDPIVVERLKPYGVNVNFIKEKLIYPVKIQSPDDYRGDGSRKGKLESAPIWIVEIVMPKKLIKQIQEGSLKTENTTLDIDNIESAYEENLNDPKGIENA